MRQLWLVLLAMAIPASPMAEVIGIRSGEHAEFSRLVISSDPAQDWNFGRVEGGYEMRLARQGARFDLRQIYQLIPRDRIAVVKQLVDGTLFLGVTCQCHAEVFKHQGKLVLDIKDGPPPSSSQFEQSLNQGSVENPLIADSQAQSPGNVNIVNEIAGSALGQPNVELPLSYVPARTNLAWGTELHETGTESSAKARSARVASAQSALIAELGRAASEGLVVPNLRMRDTNAQGAPAAGPELPENRQVTQTDPMPGSENDSLAGAANVHIETAFDRGELPSRPDDGLTADGDYCLPSSDFDIAEWGKPPENGSAISDYRRDIVGEFDEADPRSVAALARHYIYLTFGAEARGLLHSFSDTVEAADLLIQLAEIMDDGRASTGATLLDQISCETAAALWAIMAKPKLSKSANISRPAVLSAFAALPLHLRRHIGPTLAERFLQIGDVDTAASIRNTIIRAPGNHGTEVQMMSAEIALELGDHEAGTTQLANVVQSSDALAPEAVIRLIEAQLANGDPPGTKLIETAAALAFEARGTETAARLALVRLRAMVHKEQILQVLAELPRAAEEYEFSRANITSLRQETLDIATESPSDSVFLQTVLQGPLGLDNSEPGGALRRRIAHRLINLGLYGAARDTLAGIPGAPEPEDRRLYAKSYLGDRRPDLAIGYLAGLDDAEALTMRANAFVLAQDFESAANIFAQLGATEEQARAVWRGQLWQGVRAVGSETERAAVEIATLVEPTKPATAVPITLAAGESLIEQSQSSRTALQALLNSTTVP